MSTMLMALINHIIAGMKDYLEKFPMAKKEEKKEKKGKKHKSMESEGSVDCSVKHKPLVIELVSN